MFSSRFEQCNPIWKQSQDATNITVVHWVRQLKIQQPMLLLKGHVLKGDISIGIIHFPDVTEIVTG